MLSCMCRRFISVQCEVYDFILYEPWLSLDKRSLNFRHLFPRFFEIPLTNNNYSSKFMRFQAIWLTRRLTVVSVTSSAQRSIISRTLLFMAECSGDVERRLPCGGGAVLGRATLKEGVPLKSILSTALRSTFSSSPWDCSMRGEAMMPWAISVSI